MSMVRSTTIIIHLELSGFLSQAGIGASRLRFGPQGWDLVLKVGIWTLRLGFGPQGWDLDLEAGFWASRIEFRPRGKNLGLGLEFGP